MQSSSPAGSRFFLNVCHTCYTVLKLDFIFEMMHLNEKATTFSSLLHQRFLISSYQASEHLFLGCKDKNSYLTDYFVAIISNFSLCCHTDFFSCITDTRGNHTTFQHLAAELQIIIILMVEFVLINPIHHLVL